MRIRVAIAALLVHLSVMGAPAQGAAPQPAGQLRLDTPSGYPVPRFVSLKDDATNCRIGPSSAHPVRFVLKRPGAPVLIIAESVDHWRKLRDADGDECWAHQATLKAQTHILVRESVELRRRPAKGADISARLGAGVLARLVKRKGEWILVSAAKAKGWVAAHEVWGGDALADSARRD